MFRNCKEEIDSTSGADLVYGLQLSQIQSPEVPVPDKIARSLLPAVINRGPS